MVLCRAHIINHYGLVQSSYSVLFRLIVTHRSQDWNLALSTSIVVDLCKAIRMIMCKFVLPFIWSCKAQFPIFYPMESAYYFLPFPPFRDVFQVVNSSGCGHSLPKLALSCKEASCKWGRLSSLPSLFSTLGISGRDSCKLGRFVTAQKYTQNLCQIFTFVFAHAS